MQQTSAVFMTVLIPLAFVEIGTFIGCGDLVIAHLSLPSSP
jgi:hypothetical protein